MGNLRRFKEKKIKVDPWISNTIESGLMLPLALVYIFTLNHVGTSHFFSGNPAEDLTWVLVSTGVITTIPYGCFFLCSLKSAVERPRVLHVYQSDTYFVSGNIYFQRAF